MDVDTKERQSAFSDNVDTKKRGSRLLGNDGIGFVRVRHRRLKRTASASFDLVRACRVNGKPRHEFVLGLGSLKGNDRAPSYFWLFAIWRMKRHGLSELQRLRLIGEMIRKGARLPDHRDKSAWRDAPGTQRVTMGYVMSGIEAAFFGALGRDAELARVGDGDDVQWLSVLAFDPQAVEIADKFIAGARVYVEGRLSTSEWTGADGKPRFGLSVMSFHCRLAQIGRQKVRRESEKPAKASVAANNTFYDDQIPFAPEVR